MISNKSPLEKKALFIEGLKERGTVLHACETAGICRKSAYQWRKADEEFAEAWDAALEANTEALEESVYERAKRSDILAMFMLKARRPALYRENMTVEHQGNQVVKVEFVNDWRGGGGGNE